MNVVHGREKKRVLTGFGLGKPQGPGLRLLCRPQASEEPSPRALPFARRNGRAVASRDRHEPSGRSGAGTPDSELDTVRWLDPESHLAVSKSVSSATSCMLGRAGYVLLWKAIGGTAAVTTRAVDSEHRTRHLGGF